MVQSTKFLDLFSNPVDEDWAFAGQKSTNRFTHGYHRYPAKFVPNLVKKLIEEYTAAADTVVDIFAGCGTTLIESKVHGRKSIGVDVNPVARMITKAKITPINPSELTSNLKTFLSCLDDFDPQIKYFGLKHERIDYWFRGEEKNKIAFLHKQITLNRNPIMRDFYLCALSNILKPCSRWLQSGTKPQIDPTREENIADPFERILLQTKQMERQNKEFYNNLSETKFLRTKCEIRNADARSTGIKKDSVGAVITSPPYVTSYEYADIHQLTGYWFDYIEDLLQFRKKFIGTFFSDTDQSNVPTSIAKRIVENLQIASPRYAREVAKYFNDMWNVTKEIRRILRPGGIACIVIGNTTLKGVEIKSGQAFAEMLFKNSFSIVKVVRRQVTYKLNPTIRDKDSGRFTTLKSKNRKEVYPEEYIIIAKKNCDRARKEPRSPK